MRSAMSDFTLFRPESPLRNAMGIFLLTTLFYFVGAQLRLVEALSLFWPLNGVMAGVFARYAYLNRVRYYAVSYVAMLLYDAVTTRWGLASLAINASNILFIGTVALLVLRDKRMTRATPDPINALRLFNYCLFAAVLCALLGAAGSVGIDSQTFWPLFADWFSEQFSTGVLIVPCMLTVKVPTRWVRFRPEQLLPILALVVSVMASVVIGGAGSLVFPLPALIWCAVRYSLPATCLLTFVTGAVEIVLVANSIINIAVAAPLSTPMMFSARLGIATMAICPVMVSASVAAINSLIQQVSLRADYDFLTHVYSRSGLYEALKKEETHQHYSRFLTVMLLDIDYFKSINDNYGHECGDRVLSAFAQKVQEVVGEEGLVARMGGEEFAVVVNSGDAQSGLEMAERIRLSISSHPFAWRQQQLFLTVSIGLGSGKSEARELTEVFNRLMAEADDYLYRSKKAGRNRTSARMAGDIPPSEQPGDTSRV
jgi:diguanylate cyclase (GGDEF)-like protein